MKSWSEWSFCLNLSLLVWKSTFVCIFPQNTEWIHYRTTSSPHKFSLFIPIQRPGANTKFGLPPTTHHHWTFLRLEMTSNHSYCQTQVQVQVPGQLFLNFWIFLPNFWIFLPNLETAKRQLTADRQLRDSCKTAWRRVKIEWRIHKWNRQT